MSNDLFAKFNKKLFFVFFIIISIVLIYWICSVLTARCLTNTYGAEFMDISALQYDHLHAWDEEEFQIRVLSYSNDRAVVYYYSECGGEKIEFCKKNNIWQYHCTLAIWSEQGSADEYFIWPYYKSPG